jgi:hypothetical protein
MLAANAENNRLSDGRGRAYPVPCSTRPVSGRWPALTPAPLDGHGSSSGSPPRRRSPSPNDNRIVEEQGDLPDPDNDEPADEQYDAEHPSRRCEQVNLSLSNFEDSDREEDKGAHDCTLAPAHNSDTLDYEGDDTAPPAKRKHASPSKAGDVLDGDTLNYKDDGAAPPAKRKHALPSKAGAKMASCRDDALDSDALDYEDDGAAPPAKRKRASLSSKAGAKKVPCKDDALNSGVLDKDASPDNNARRLSSEHPAETSQASKRGKQRKAPTQKNAGKAARTVKQKADSVSNKSSANTEQRKKLQSSAK